MWCWWPLIFLAFAGCCGNNGGRRRRNDCPRGRELPERFSFPPMRRYDLNPFECNDDPHGRHHDCED